MGCTLSRLCRLPCRSTETSQFNCPTEIGWVFGITNNTLRKSPNRNYPEQLAPTRRHATRRHAARTVISSFFLSPLCFFPTFSMQAISSDLSILILPLFPGFSFSHFFSYNFSYLYPDFKRSAHRLGGRELTSEIHPIITLFDEFLSSFFLCWPFIFLITYFTKDILISVKSIMSTCSRPFFVLLLLSSVSFCARTLLNRPFSHYGVLRGSSHEIKNNRICISFGEPAFVKTYVLVVIWDVIQAILGVNGLQVQNRANRCTLSQHMQTPCIEPQPCRTM